MSRCTRRNQTPHEAPTQESKFRRALRAAPPIVRLAYVQNAMSALGGNLTRAECKKLFALL